MSSPATSESSIYPIHDPPGFIKPSLQDMPLTEITAEELLKIAERLGSTWDQQQTFLAPFRNLEKFMETTNDLWSLSLVAEMEITQSPSTSSSYSRHKLSKYFFVRKSYGGTGCEAWIRYWLDDGCHDSFGYCYHLPFISS